MTQEFTAGISLTEQCNQKCSHCLDGNTLILMSDLSYKKLKDVVVGDSVMGLKSISRRGRLIPSKVLGKSEIIKKAFSVKTEFASVVCSSDHLWSLDRARWRSIDDNLMIGQGIRKIKRQLFVEREVDDDYKKGYLRGIIFGDGSLKKYIGKKRDIIWHGKKYIANKTKIFKFRLAMNDKEAINRAKEYLQHFGISVFEHLHKDVANNYMPSIRRDGYEFYYTLKRLLRVIDSDSFKAGYLGGIFDAEGSIGNYYVRIHNRYLQECSKYLKHFGFKFSLFEGKIGGFNKDKAPETVKNVSVLTLNGGIDEVVRFFNLCQPIIKRKSDISCAIQNGYSKVLYIKSVGVRVLYDIQTETENFVANGLVSHNCYIGRKVFWKDESYHFKFIPVEKFDRLVSELVDANVSRVNFGGGESPLHKDFGLLVKLLYDAGIKIALTTNGSTMPIIRPYLHLFNDVGVSLDFPDERHSVNRRSPKAFMWALSALNELVSSGVRSELVTCIMNSNVYDLPKIHDLANSLGVDMWRLNRFHATKNDVVRFSSNISGLDDAVDISYLSCSKAEMRYAFEFLASVSPVDKSFYSIPDPVFRSFVGGVGVVSGVPYGKLSFRVKSDGGVVSNLFLDEPIGNIFLESLKDIVSRFSDSYSIDGKCVDCHNLFHCGGGDLTDKFLSGESADPYCFLDTKTPSDVSFIPLSDTNFVHESYIGTIYVPIKWSGK